MFMPFEERISYVHVLFNTKDIIWHDAVLAIFKWRS